MTPTTRRLLWIAACLLSHLLTFSPSHAAPPAERIAAAVTHDVGFALDVGCGDAALAIELAKRTKLTFRCVDSEAAAIARARKAIDAAGLYGVRVTAQRERLDTLHYPTYCASLLICGDQFVDGLRGRDFKEILRLLHPKGVAVIGQGAAAARRAKTPLDKATLEEWLKAAGITAYEIDETDGVWATIRRERPAGWDEWRHRSHDPANTYASDDTIDGSEFSLLWAAPPQPALASAAILVADGKLIEIGRAYPTQPATTPYIQVSDAFTGLPLWKKVGRKQVGIQRPLADYSAIRSCSDVAAADGRLYVLGGKRCHVLDLEDGRNVRTFAIPAEAAPRAADIWVYMACVDGLLVGSAGRSPGHRTGWGGTHWRGVSTAVFALDRPGGDVKWSVPTKAHTSSIVIAEGKLLYLDTQMVIHCLQIVDGKELWTKPTDLPAAGRVTHAMLHAGRLWVTYTPDTDTGSKARDAGWQVAVFSAADGTLVHKPQIATPVASMTAHGGAVYMAPQHGPGQIYSLDAATGKVTGTMLPRASGSKCTPICATPNWLLYRHQAGGGFIRIDRKTQRRYEFHTIRCTCHYPGLPAYGLLFVQGPGCNCSHQFRANTAVIPGGRRRYVFKDPDERLVKGPAYDRAPKDAVQTAWVGWRGDVTRSGRTAEVPDGELTEAWRIQPGGTLTPVAMAEGRIFVGSTNRKLLALDVGTGKPAWQYITAGRVRVTPHYWRGRVYFGDDDGWVYCLTAADGRLVWKFKVALGPDRVVAYGDFQSAWPAGNGVVVHNGDAYCTAGFFPGEKGRLYVLDAVTGKYRWSRDRVRLRQSSYECGAGAMAVGETILFMPTVGGPARGAYLDKPDEGYFNLKWRRAGAPRGRQIMTLGDRLLAGSSDLQYIHHVITYHDERRCLPIVTDEVIYLRDGRRLTAERRAAYKLFDRGGTFTWTKTRLTGRPHPSPDPADVLWSAWPDVRMVAAIEAGGTLFTGSAGRIHATDAKTGRQVFSAPVPGPVTDLAFAGGRLSVVTASGSLVCFLASR